MPLMIHPHRPEPQNGLPPCVFISHSRIPCANQDTLRALAFGASPLLETCACSNCHLRLCRRLPHYCVSDMLGYISLVLCLQITFATPPYSQRKLPSDPSPYLTARPGRVHPTLKRSDCNTIPSDILTISITKRQEVEEFTPLRIV